MSKIEKLLDKTRRTEDTKKWRVYAGIVVGLVLLFSILIGVYTYADVDGYLLHHKETPQLYDFYDLKVGETQKAVYLVGNSLIGTSCYAPLINKYLQEKGCEYVAYNIYTGGDTPVRRATQIQNIIDSSPALIVYGVTYHDVTVSNWQSERIILVHDGLKIRDDSLHLFSELEKQDFDVVPTLLWKKSYISSALSAKGKNTGEDYAGSYLTDIYGRDMNQILHSSPVEVKDLSDANYMAAHVPAECTRFMEALIYNVKTLQDAGIPVVIVNMPLHPAVSELLTDESRQNMSALLNQTGVHWYDLEHKFGVEYFSDSHHASSYGVTLFTPVIGDIIMEAV